MLTATAKLRGQADPVIALAASCILASLAMPDAHPSYLASSAAAVVTSQLLQADQHDLPSIMAASSGGGAAAAAAGGASAETAQQAAMAADPGLRPALARVLLVVTEGQLGRHLAAELGAAAGPPGGRNSSGANLILPGSHLPLVLLAMVQATSTDSTRIHFADRIKHNLRKVRSTESTQNPGSTHLGPYSTAASVFSKPLRSIHL